MPSAINPSRPGCGNFDVREIFSDFDFEREMILGYESDGHGYLLINHFRYDGAAMGDNNVLQSNSQASLGALLRMKKVPGERRSALLEILSMNLPFEGVACIDKLARALEAAGLKIRGARVIPGEIFKKSVLNGFESYDGKKIPFKRYVTPGVDLAAIYQAIRRREKAAIHGLQNQFFSLAQTKPERFAMMHGRLKEYADLLKDDLSSLLQEDPSEFEHYRTLFAKYLGPFLALTDETLLK
ncbi:MAG: hypothetical protein HY537_09855 [Deltaproteobacteria bacterium]|nr:hypothetical protein [Deltaproteobacteria bacterium]